jgi:uncharacterized protein YggE
MKYIIASLLLAAMTCAPALAQPATVYAAPPPESTLTLQGDGLVNRAPDVAKLTVQIVTNDDNATVSSSNNNDIYNTLRSRLAAIGIGSDALATSSYNVVFVPHPPRGLPPEQQQPRYGYITTRFLTVTVSPIENLGKVMDAATAAGVTTVGNISFSLKDRKSVYTAALGAAMQDVGQSAQAVATAGGFTIVRIRSVVVGYTYVPLEVSAAPMMRMAAVAPTPTDIQPNGPIAVTAHVTVTYLIK